MLKATRNISFKFDAELTLEIKFLAPARYQVMPYTTQLSEN